jgi:hypothetical protein
LISSGATSQVSNLNTYGFTVTGSLVYGSDGKLYAPSSSGGIVQIDPSTGSAVQYIAGSAFATSQERAITADSTNLWVSDIVSAGQYNLYSVPIGSSSPTATLLGTYSSEIGNTTMVSAGSYLYVDAGPGISSGLSVEQITKTSGAVAAVAGSGSSGYANGTGSDAWFSSVTGLGWDGTNLWVSDNTNYRIRQIAPTTPPATGMSSLATTTVSINPGDVSTYAGSATSGLVNDTGTRAQFYGPGGSVVVGGFLYVLDTSNSLGEGFIRKVDINSGKVSTLAGASSSTMCVDNTDST